MRLYILALALALVLAACSTAPNTEAAGQKPAAPAKPEPKPEEQLPEKATAVFETTAGRITCELFPQEAPKTVANFIGLAEGTKTWVHPASGSLKRNTPLYNGTIFHRVIPNFMIQGGDPAGTGQGDPGFRFEDELRPDLKFDRPGRLAMANAGSNTNGSQFFITEVPVPHLDACLDEKGCTRGQRKVSKGFGHTIFGQCDAASVEVVKNIARRGRDMRTDRPNTPVRITKVTIVRGKGEEKAPPAPPAGVKVQ